MTDDKSFSLSCPPPHSDDTVQLAHGGGGRAMARLLDTIIRPAFSAAGLQAEHDGAVFTIDAACAFTTDSYVVQPLFFPGGNIGTLAVNGTVNDLAMCGAEPLYLSVSFILEEGLPLQMLRNVVASMRDAATAAQVQLLTGDTKVVERGKADGVFINTAGVGRVVARNTIGPSTVRPGDAIILSGDIGRHGMAVMTAREGFEFETPIASDCAPLAEPILALMNAGVDIHCLRDLTRGGLASALVEIAEAAGLTLTINEEAVPVADNVTAACELLGLDPLHVANEGRFITFVPQQDCAHTLSILRDFNVSADAVVIGEVRTEATGIVTCRGTLGVERVIDMLNGEQLPRIC